MASFGMKIFSILSKINDMNEYSLNLNYSSADDSVSNQKVAIKKLSKPFATNIHAKRAYREIRLLKHVDHDNIIKLYDLFSKSDNAHDLDDM